MNSLIASPIGSRPARPNGSDESVGRPRVVDCQGRIRIDERPGDRANEADRGGEQERAAPPRLRGDDRGDYADQRVAAWQPIFIKPATEPADWRPILALNFQ